MIPAGTGPIIHPAGQHLGLSHNFQHIVTLVNRPTTLWLVKSHTHIKEVNLLAHMHRHAQCHVHCVCLEGGDRYHLHLRPDYHCSPWVLETAPQCQTSIESQSLTWLFTLPQQPPRQRAYLVRSWVIMPWTLVLQYHLVSGCQIFAWKVAGQHWR